MRALALLIAADLVLLTVMGLVVLAWLPMPWRARLLPAAPALGAAILVVALHATSLVVGVRTGTVVVVVAGVAALGVRSLRCRWWAEIGRGSWLLVIVALLAGGASLTLVSKPFRAAGPTVFGSANDAFYYVSLTDWFLDHSALTTPVRGVDAPAYGLTAQTLHQGLSLGEEMDAGAVAAVTAHDPITTWSATTLVWLLLIPGAGIACFEILELNRGAGIAGGLIVAGSAVIADQVLSQNSSGLLGILLAPPAIAVWARYFRGTDRPPAWLAAILLDSVVGAYAEYLPLIGGGLVLYALVGRTNGWTRTLRDGAKLAAIAIVLGPLPWLNAARSLALASTLGGTSGFVPNSPFLNVPTATWVARVTGTSSYAAASHLTLGYLLAALIGVGVLVAVAWSPARAIFASVLFNVIAVALLLGSRFHYFSYGEFRAVGTGLSLVLLAAVAGWAEAVVRFARLAANRAWVAVAVAFTAAAGALFVGANQRTLSAHASQDWSAQTVSTDFSEAAAWTASVGAREAGVTALMPDYFSQLWSLYTLRHQPQVDFPFVYPDYTAVPPLAYYDGRLRRYVVLGGALFSRVSPAAVVGETPRFTFLDLARGSVMLAVGVENAEAVETTPQGVRQWLSNDGMLLVAHTDDVRSVTLTLQANPSLTAVPVTISVDGGAAAPYVISAAGTTVTVPLGAGTMSLVRVDNLVPARALAPTDLRPVSVLVESVGVR